MKQHWPIFFLGAILLFQGYVYLWNKNQTITLATRGKAATPSVAQSYSTPTTMQRCFSQFIYPHTATSGNTATTSFMESPDEPTQILEWYKETLQREDVSNIADMTNTMNNISSTMLVGEKNNQQITIVIGKAAEERNTTIFLHWQCK